MVRASRSEHKKWAIFSVARLIMLAAAWSLFVSAQFGFAGPIDYVDSGQQLGQTDSRAVALGDLNGDGNLDALVADTGNNGRYALQAWFNGGNGTFADGGVVADSQAFTPLAVALADLNGDGFPDAMVATSGGGRVWVNDKHGRLTRSSRTAGT